MYIGGRKLGSFRVFGSSNGPRRVKLGSFRIFWYSDWVRFAQMWGGGTPGI